MHWQEVNNTLVDRQYRDQWTGLIVLDGRLHTTIVFTLEVVMWNSVTENKTRLHIANTHWIDHDTTRSKEHSKNPQQLESMFGAYSCICIQNMRIPKWWNVLGSVAIEECLDLRFTCHHRSDWSVFYAGYIDSALDCIAWFSCALPTILQLMKSSCLLTQKHWARFAIININKPLEWVA